MVTPHRRNNSGVYYFRRAIPATLRQIIGKTEFNTSLGTSNLSEAKRLILDHIESSEHILAMARLKLNGTTSHNLNPRDCAIIASRWSTRMFSQIESTGQYSDFLTCSVDPQEPTKQYLFGLSDTLCIQGSETLRASNEQWADVANDLRAHIDSQLFIESIVIPHDHSDYIQLTKHFYRQLISLEALCLARHNHNWLQEPTGTALSLKPLSFEATPINTTTNLRTSYSESSTGPTINQVYDKFRQSDLLTSKGDSSREKTLNETRSQVARFVSIMGDLSINTIGKRDIASFRDILLQLPKSKEKAIRSKSIEQQLALADSQGLPKISTTTVTNALKQLSPVFTYAISIDLIAINPTLGMKPKHTTKKVEVDNTDRGYSPDDINKIFQSTLFTTPSNKLTYGQACYWIPLICYHTGMRLNEVCQLNKSDISMQDTIAFINIRRGLNQSVKNDSSLRHVPISNQLIELGFLDYVDSTQDSLFPKLPQGTYSKPSSKFSAWWSKHIDCLSITIRQPSHAFRHTFKTNMRIQGTEDSVSDAITGHAASNEGSRYGSVPLETKQTAINKLTRLGISRIY